MSSHLHDLSRYEVWADRALIESLQTVADRSDARVLHLLGHFVAAKVNWLDRLDGVAATAPLWPQWTMDDCLRRLEQADERLLSRSPAVCADPARVVNYRTTTGAAWSTPVHILWTHLINHGTYHRGQLATAIKAAGGNPAATDFILWHRAGSP